MRLNIYLYSEHVTISNECLYFLNTMYVANFFFKYFLESGNLFMISLKLIIFFNFLYDMGIIDFSSVQH